MLDLIKTRRSVRKYDGREVSRADVKDILEAGMYAPSAGNEQAWQFVVLEGEVFSRYLAINRNVPQTAPMGVLVCTDSSREKYTGMNLSRVDCSAAVENMLLAAHAKGLGAIWTWVFEQARADIKKLLLLPDHVEPFSLVAIGYTAEKAAVHPERYDEKRIHWSRW